MDGSTFGSYADIDIDGYSSDNAYGALTNISKDGYGSLYGNYIYTTRPNGYGRTYGLYNYTVYSPDSGSTSFETHANHTKLISNPEVDIEVVGNYLDLNRGGDGYGSTYGQLYDIDYNSDHGIVYGSKIDVSRSNSGTAHSYGSYIGIEAEDGYLKGLYVDAELGVSNQSSSGTLYGAEVYANRIGTGNSGSAGIYTEGANNGTGTGYRTASGITTYGYQYSSSGSSYSYGIYATAAGGDAEYSGYFAGDVYAYGSYLPSDVKLKHSIEDAQSSLGKILGLKVYNYEYDHSTYAHMRLPNGNQTGFLAQELKESFPELTKHSYQQGLRDNEINHLKEMGIEVSELATEGVEFTAVNYVGLIPHLTKAMQEQQEIIDAQQKKLDEQAVEMKKLEDRLSALEAAVNGSNQ